MLFYDAQARKFVPEAVILVGLSQSDVIDEFVTRITRLEEESGGNPVFLSSAGGTAGARNQANTRRRKLASPHLTRKCLDAVDVDSDSDGTAVQIFTLLYSVRGDRVGEWGWFARLATSTASSLTPG
ncbi:hypothetical protein KQX54_004168 [Cotesia glomerata]|uniref:Uncharacterized protein n=1 Tax=Cotesia glomerata TaxID=32391 RepID=A0AAV7IUF3_COTGL|nr:hypothetical protein KQX54_004168 [Cotesia glomerata]